MDNKIKTAICYVVGILMGLGFFALVVSIYNLGKGTTLTYGRINPEQQTVYITGTYHGQPVDMTAALHNTVPDTLAETGVLEGSIGDERISFYFSKDTEKGEWVCERYGLYYATPTYDDTWLTAKMEKALGQQFIGASGGNSSHNTTIEVPYSENPINALYYDMHFITDEDKVELMEKFPVLHAFLSDEDLKENITVRVCTEDNQKKSYRDSRILLIELSLHSYNKQLDGETKLQFIFN